MNKTSGGLLSCAEFTWKPFSIPFELKCFIWKRIEILSKMNCTFVKGLVRLEIVSAETF
jgi:hypothetical protein